jgi:hypothetical protein
MTKHVRVDALTGRMVRDPAGRRVGRIRELVAEVERPGSGEYVVREFHLSGGGLLEAVGGSQLARVIADRLGRKSNRIVVSWRDLDISDPEHPRLVRPLAEVVGPGER